MNAAKNTYTTKELGSLLGVVPQNVIERGKREGWCFHPLKKRGGGNLWLLDSMPEATRQDIAESLVAQVAKKHCLPKPELFTGNTLTEVADEKREQATARALLLQMADEYKIASGMPRSTAYEVFSSLYNESTIEAPAWVRTFIARTSRASLNNWRRQKLTGGLAALVGKQGEHRKGSGLIDSTPGMVDYIVAELVTFYEVSAATILEGLEARFINQPSLRILQRWMKNYREQNKQVLLKIQNPDAWRSEYQAAAGSRSEGISRPNQLWELDSSPTDLMLADGRRHTLLACIDVATRRVIFHLAKTSNSQGVCALLRRALLTFGKPETIKMDNGSDYRSFQVESVIHDLGIIPQWCTPYTPEEKPHVERIFQTFQHSFITRLPGFIGHSVADRKAIESRKSFAERNKKGKNPQQVTYTPEELQTIATEWALYNYGEKVHSTLGTSPNALAAQLSDTIIRIADERALDILLLPVANNQGLRTVGKKGIRVENAAFDAPELGGLEGESVQVRFDENNAGYIYIFDLNGIFICRAEDPRLTGVSRRELSLARRKHQKVVVNRHVKEAKKVAREQKPYETAAMIMEMKKEQGIAKQAERAKEYGSNEEFYTTPALKQAARAAQSALPATIEKERVFTPAQHARLEQIEQSNTLVRAPSRADSFARSLWLEQILANGEEINPEDSAWLVPFKRSSIYKYYSMIMAQGGELPADVALSLKALEMPAAHAVNV